MITKYCPFCKVQMIRPRSDMINNNGRPMFDAHDWKAHKRVKYNDYMCPKCSVVLLYGEKSEG